MQIIDVLWRGLPQELSRFISSVYSLNLCEMDTFSTHFDTSHQAASTESSQRALVYIDKAHP